MTSATCTPDVLRFDLLEVAIDDTLKRRLILGLLFRDTLGVDIIQGGGGPMAKLENQE